MNRRSKAGREATNRRPRKTSKPERGSAPKSQVRIKSTPAVEETELARLTHELTSGRRQRVATSEVLRLLSGSHGNLNHLFDTILANATNLCQANFGTLSLCDPEYHAIDYQQAFGVTSRRNRAPEQAAALPAAAGG